jgi:hypothetical protein
MYRRNGKGYVYIYTEVVKFNSGESDYGGRPTAPATTAGIAGGGDAPRQGAPAVS